MALNAEQVYEAGLELDLDERAVVAHRLLASLHPDVEAEVDAAWQDEIAKRIDEIQSGNAQLADADETYRLLSVAGAAAEVREGMEHIRAGQLADWNALAEQYRTRK